MSGSENIGGPNYANGNGEFDEAQHERNLDFLRGSEYGTQLIPFYEAAVSYDERLSQTELVAIPDNASSLTLAYAEPGGRAGDEAASRHRVYLRLGNDETTEISLTLYLDELAVSCGLLCEVAQVDIDKLSPITWLRLAMLHELGHIETFLDVDPADYTAQRNADMAKLPVPRLAASQVLDREHEVRRMLTRYKEKYQALGITTFEELMIAQQIAYRRTKTESDADYFVAHVLDANPRLRADLA